MLPNTYFKQTASRHRYLILDFYGFKEFDLLTECIIREEITRLIRARLKPKLIFFRVVDNLIQQRIAVLSYDFLSKMILEEIRNYKLNVISLLQQELSIEQRAKLDDLLEKSPADASSLPTLNHRYRLTLLKKFSQSTKPRKIKASVEDFHLLQSLYQEFEQLIEKLSLTCEGIQHYAGSVIRSEVFQITRRVEEDKYLHLLAFIAHQYFGLQDILVEMLLRLTQTFVNVTKREHKELYYQNRQEHKQQLNKLVKIVDGNVLVTLTKIKEITNSTLPDTEKVHFIKDILDLLEPHQQELQSQINPLKNDLEHSNVEDKDFYKVMEKRSKKLQQRVTPILKALNFISTSSTSTLMQAIEYFKLRKGVIRKGAPLDWLESFEKQIVLNQTGNIRTSLYKAFLSIKISEAIKSGTLNFKHSYKYRSLVDYLIPEKDWQQYKQTYLQQANLLNFEDLDLHLSQLQTILDSAYHQTNKNILNNSNQYISFRPTGEYVLTTPPTQQMAREELESFFPAKKYVSLLEILSTINRLTAFIEELEHWQPTQPHLRPADHVFIAAIVSQGCDIGTSKMASISTNVKETELEHTLNWFFSIEGIRNANDRLLHFTSRLELPNVYLKNPNSLHTSSDGQKFEVEKDSLNASYSFKYFGGGKGVSVYTFIDERNLLFHSNVITSAERESHYAIDGLMLNDVVKSNIHSTDTHGYSEIIFATMHLLGFSFAPRIKDFKKQHLYAFETRRSYKEQGYRIIPDGYINTKLISENSDYILRFIATIKLKVATASDLFRRLNSYSRQHNLYKALKEFGKIPKSQHILRWIDDVTHRQSVEKQLNRVEHSNRLSRAVNLANPYHLSFADKQEQEIAEGCRRLIKNAIICWNYLYLSQKIVDENNLSRKHQIIEAIRSGSVVCWQHINMLGEYDFSEEKLQDSFGFQLPKILSLDIPNFGS